MAYDSVRERLVMFGGMVNGGLLSNATLEFDGTQWQAVPNASPPSARTGHAMAFDESRGVIVLFGGTISTGVSAATFEYDGVWRMVSPTVSPPGLKWHAMAYDPVRHLVVLHGGMLANGSTSSQTYEFNGGTWTPRGGGGPGLRYQHSMAFDAVTQTMIVYGGRTSEFTLYSSETWGWNGSTWHEITGVCPSPRASAAMVGIPQLQRIVLFGGNNGTLYYGSTWEFHTLGWNEVSPAANPQPRSDAAIGWHAATGQMVIAGGTNGTARFADTWQLQIRGGPQFTESPRSQAGETGRTITFVGTATGVPFLWRWHHNGNLVENDSRISGASTPTLTITGLLESDGGVYEAEATNACGTTRSAPATLTVLPACGTSDFNGDGDFGTDSDIEAFFACLAGNCCGTCLRSGADFNGDGDTGTDADIEAFFRVLAGGPC